MCLNVSYGDKYLEKCWMVTMQGLIAGVVIFFRVYKCLPVCFLFPKQSSAVGVLAVLIEGRGRLLAAVRPSNRTNSL
jgi:hypothetical protein